MVQVLKFIYKGGVSHILEVIIQTSVSHKQQNRLQKTILFKTQSCNPKVMNQIGISGRDQDFQASIRLCQGLKDLSWC